jgi:uncharacterized protein (DUF2132 family)
MTDRQSNNPMQGMTLEKILNVLVETFTWEGLGARIKIRCFNTDPSVKSSLAFLRKTPWARKKVESLFLATVKRTAAKKRKR